MTAVRLRAHNLLCIQGFVGKGYSPGFVANMRRVIDSLVADTPVRVVADPDEICAACPNLLANGCALHGPGSEGGIVSQDRDVLARLGMEAEQLRTWGSIRARIRDNIAPDDLDAICGRCPWLPLGVCKSGLRALGHRP